MRQRSADCYMGNLRLRCKFVSMNLKLIYRHRECELIPDKMIRKSTIRKYKQIPLFVDKTVVLTGFRCIERAEYNRHY